MAEGVLNDLVEWIRRMESSSEDFLSREVPLYAQEVIAWYFWTSAIQAIVAGLFVVLLTVCAWKAIHADMEEAETVAPGAKAVTVVATLLGTALSIGICVEGIVGAVKATVAPRLIIVEHVRGIAS